MSDQVTEIGLVVSEIVAVLNSCHIPYLIGGSLASSIWGHPRQTNDADIVISISDEQVECLVSSLKDRYLVSRNEILEAINDRGAYPSFQLLHMELLWKVDVFVKGTNPYDSGQFARSRSLQVFSDVTMNYSSPEDTIIQKLRWFELGNRVSDRQWNDIVQVLEVQKGLLDEGYLDRWTGHFGLKQLLDEARSQTFD